jgi:5-methylcytosine-specific restriction protein B
MDKKIKEYIIEFLNFSNEQEKGKGVKGLIDFSKKYVKQYRDLKVDFSVGKGRATHIPWVTFLGKDQKTQNGIYPAFLYYKEQNILILAYGVSVTNSPGKKWKIDNPKSINDYFTQNELDAPEKYGQSFIYQVYNPNKLNEYDIDSDIDRIIDEYNLILNNQENEIQNHTKRIFEFKNFESSGLKITDILITRFISSLLTKPFVILTGLSGSGKTKLAQAFAMWMSGSKEQYAIVPVGADWTNREPLLGYPNSLKPQHYVKPDSGVLDILLSAHRNFIENDGDLSLCKPFFLILDEMNLSHVERYFADFLSAMESGDEIKLYSGTDRYDNLDEKGAPILGDDPIPNTIVLPKNLFIIGTVNIDETTYMFSPKVLDRANTIEFRISKDEMAKFLDKHEPLDMEQLLEDVSNQIGKGASQTSTFMTLATRKNLKIERNLHLDVFVSFFKELQFAGAEFGYRTANEMSVLVGYLTYFGLSENDAYDIAIMQKMLPKLHGSRSKLGRILPALIELCENKYPISFEKLTRMKKSAEENGFASYAEA